VLYNSPSSKEQPSILCIFPPLNIATEGDYRAGFVAQASGCHKVNAKRFTSANPVAIYNYINGLVHVKGAYQVLLHQGLDYGQGSGHVRQLKPRCLGIS